MSPEEFQRLKEKVLRARSLVREHRNMEKYHPFDERIKDIYAEAVVVTGPYLLGEFDHLRETDRPSFEVERLKALAADQKRQEQLAEVEKDRQTLIRLEVEYNALAVELADNL